MHQKGAAAPTTQMSYLQMASQYVKWHGQKNALTILISSTLQNCPSAQLEFTQYVLIKFLIDAALHSTGGDIFVHASLLLESVMKYDAAIETVTGYTDLLLSIAGAATNTAHGIECQMLFSNLMQSIIQRWHLCLMDATPIHCFSSFCQCLHATALEDADAYMIHCLQQHTILQMLSHNLLRGFQTLYLSVVASHVHANIRHCHRHLFVISAYHCYHLYVRAIFTTTCKIPVSLLCNLSRLHFFLTRISTFSSYHPHSHERNETACFVW